MSGAPNPWATSKAHLRSAFFPPPELHLLSPSPPQSMEKPVPGAKGWGPLTYMKSH